MNDVKQLKKELLKRKDELLTSDPTLYCSAMAHLRDKLHMSRINGGTLYELAECGCWEWFGYNNKECIADERRHMFNWTMDDQKEYVHNLLCELRESIEQEAEDILEEKIAQPTETPTVPMSGLRSFVRRLIGI